MLKSFTNAEKIFCNECTVLCDFIAEEDVVEEIFSVDSQMLRDKPTCLW